MLTLTQLPYQQNNEHYFKRICDLPGSVWLDSAYPHCQFGQFDIISAQPSETRVLDTPEQFAQLQHKLDHHRCEAQLPFTGGWIGLIPFGFNHRSLKVRSIVNKAPTPAQFGWYDWALISDHHRRSTVLVQGPGCPAELIEEIRTRLSDATAAAADPGFSVSKFHSDTSKKEYLHALELIKRHLLDGDCYQVNYAQRFSAKFSGSAVTAYCTLRNKVPSPFSAYLNFPERQILSISPERFIQIRANRVLTQPIKGTSARSPDSERDRLWAQQLFESQKNRAENVMIVDLLRNDLSRHCTPHSVKVSELFAIQSFSNVHHLVSSVRGELMPGTSHSDFILSCFPGGSISGAPKRRALEIIEALETQPRGPYCGSIGYFSCNQRSDFNIAIRTLELRDSHISAWAGGGIVADSIAEDEYLESLTKIETFLETLEQNSLP